MPAFYGEPVPDDDDIIIEGTKRKSNLRKNVVQEEEPIPGDENVEIDFCKCISGCCVLVFSNARQLPTDDQIL